MQITSTPSRTMNSCLLTEALTHDIFPVIEVPIRNAQSPLKMLLFSAFPWLFSYLIFLYIHLEHKMTLSINSVPCHVDGFVCLGLKISRALVFLFLLRLIFNFALNVLELAKLYIYENIYLTQSILNLFTYFHYI